MNTTAIPHDAIGPRSAGLRTNGATLQELKRLYDRLGAANVTIGPLALDQIIEMEPAVADLLERARHERLCCGWYKQAGLKSQICGLVGWGAMNPQLTSAEVYETVYFAALNSLLQDECPLCDAIHPNRQERRG